MVQHRRKLVVIITVLFLFAQLVYARDDIDEVSGLSEHEVQEMEFIREEEKLAKDIYLVFYEVWGIKTFNNIAESEQKHMDAMLNLLNMYGIDDPVGVNDIGVFTNEVLQTIYDELLNWGMKSEIDAILVGAFIEEFDSLDLEHAMEMTEEVALDKVYKNLCEGSYNHLESFIYAHEGRTNETFEQATLEAALEAEILGIEEENPGTKAKISTLRTYTEEELAEFMLEITLAPGAFTEYNNSDEDNEDSDDNEDSEDSEDNEDNEDNDDNNENIDDKNYDDVNESKRFRIQTCSGISIIE